MRNKNYHIYGDDKHLAELLFEYKLLGFGVDYHPGHLIVLAQRPSDEEERKFLRLLTK